MKTVFIKSRYFSPKDFMVWLDKKKYKYVNPLKDKSIKHIDFIYIDSTTGKQNKQYIYDNVDVEIMSYVSLKVEFPNKDILHEYVLKKDKKLFDKYFMKQQTITDQLLKKLSKSKMYIVKPIPGYAGEGIKVFNGPSGIKEHIKNSKSKKNKWVIQDYIKEPLLLNGRKFHMRIMVLLCNGEMYFYKDFLVYPAKKKYSVDDLSEEVHDTHGTLTKAHEKRMFPADFSNMAKVKEVYMDIAKMFLGLKKIGLFEHKCYDHQCYELYGADVMLTKNYKPKCLEINYKPGLTNFLRRMPNLLKGILELTVMGKKEATGYYKI